MTSHLLQSIRRNVYQELLTEDAVNKLTKAIKRDIRLGRNENPATIIFPGDNNSRSISLSKAESEALLGEISERYKWYTRFYVSEGRKEHVQLLDATNCNYNVQTQECRIPGIVRGPDQTEDQFPNDSQLTVNNNTYLIPVHQAVQHGPFIKLANICSKCSPDIFPTTMPAEQVDRFGELEKPFICPECGEPSNGFSKDRYVTEFIHQKPNNDIQTDNCRTDKEGQRQYMDWLTGVSPGDTLKTPMQMPTEPTTVTGDFEVLWHSPADPLTSPPDENDPTLPPLVSIDHDEFPGPVAITPDDINILKAGLRSHNT
jgi:hypothetical protein